MKPAVFSFVRYKFNRSSFDLTNIGPNTSLEMDLHPSGKFLEKKEGVSRRCSSFIGFRKRSPEALCRSESRSESSRRSF